MSCAFLCYSKQARRWVKVFGGESNAEVQGGSLSCDFLCYSERAPVGCVTRRGMWRAASSVRDAGGKKQVYQ